MTTIRRVTTSIFRFLLPATLGVLLIGELVALTLFLIPLMGIGDSLGDGTQPVSTVWWSGTVNRPMLFVIVSLAGGALGGALHAVASLTSHVAAGDFGARWTLWYLTNPFVGAALAAVFLFVLQAGLGGQAATGTTQGGLFGIAAMAALTGLFSRHALAKLKDIFDVVFASRESVQRAVTETGGGSTGSAGDSPAASGTTASAASAGTPEGPVVPAPVAPAVVQLVPPAVAVDGSDVELTIVASGLVERPQAEVGHLVVPISAAGADSVSVVVPAAVLEHPGRVPVRIASDGVWSESVDLEVVP